MRVLGKGLDITHAMLTEAYERATLQENPTGTDERVFFLPAEKLHFLFHRHEPEELMPGVTWCKKCWRYPIRPTLWDVMTATKREGANPERGCP